MQIGQSGLQSNTFIISFSLLPKGELKDLIINNNFSILTTSSVYNLQTSF